MEDFSIFDASGRVTTNFVRSVFLFRRTRSLIRFHKRIFINSELPLKLYVWLFDRQWPFVLAEFSIFAFSLFFLLGLFVFPESIHEYFHFSKERKKLRKSARARKVLASEQQSWVNNGLGDRAPAIKTRKLRSDCEVKISASYVTIPESKAHCDD